KELAQDPQACEAGDRHPAIEPYKRSIDDLTVIAWHTHFSTAVARFAGSRILSPLVPGAYAPGFMLSSASRTLMV
ncbi:MAG TPA: hypothetical protein VII34_12155, partial [Pyrinomonadaceae bacterium]